MTSSGCQDTTCTEELDSSPEMYLACILDGNRKVTFLKPSILAADTIYRSSPHFQEDSNALKYVLFGYNMNKL
jgi:hypothetical protein